MLPRITEVRHIQDYRLELSFTDGTRGEVDLRDWIVGTGGVFAALEDPAFFRQVRVNSEAGTIEWPNDVDFCPDVLYSKVTGKPVPFAEPDETTPPRRQSA
jgi:Protein of unknown function (DUF2442)